MSKVLFARTRHDYMPYGDFFRVAELSLYPVVWLDEVDWQAADQTVIASPFNGEWLGLPTAKKTRLIWWNIERANPNTDYRRGGYDVPPYVDEVWCSDAQMSANTGARYVFLGGHRELAGIVQLEREYDLIMLMAIFGRRNVLMQGLRQFRVADMAGGTWGNERHYRMRKTALMLSAHQDEMQYLEPPRFMLAGCYGLPIITETVADGGHYRRNVDYLDGSLDALPGLAWGLLHDEVRLSLMGRAIHHLICHDRPFRREVEAAL